MHYNIYDSVKIKYNKSINYFCWNYGGIMNKVIKKVLSLMLCLTVALSMCLTFTSTADAATSVSNGGTVSAVDVNSVSSFVPGYTMYVPARTSKAYKFTVKLPSNGGTVFVMSSDDAVYGVKVNGGYSSDSLTMGDGKLRSFYVASGTTATLEMTPYSETKAYNIPFGVWCAPINRTVTGNGAEYVLGASGSSAPSTVTFRAPSDGYVDVVAYGGMSTPYYSAQVFAPGFSAWEYLYSSEGYSTRIGVAAGGTYNINVKSSSAVRNVRVTFHSIKETSAKTSKKKAAKLKKKKINHGLVYTNNKKVHWYKIKQKKNSKMTLVVNGSAVGDGGSYGNLKITVYFPKKGKQYTTLPAGKIGTYTVTSGRIGTKKARKGTYYVKIESVGGANGYYTLQWK